ncbi:hypothetical protein CCP3SC15_150007 [Gammaproteobacteria bacterium]
MITRIIHWLSAVTLGSAIVLIFYFSYLLLWPIEVCYFYPDSFITTKTVYQSRDILTYRTHIRKNINLSAVVIQSFVDGIVHQLPDRITNNPVGESDFINTSVVIPPGLPLGKYHFTTTVVYKINAFRDVTYTFKSNEFEITDESSRLP